VNWISVDATAHAGAWLVHVGVTVIMAVPAATARQVQNWSVGFVWQVAFVQERSY
jgi:hypothetical protein